MINKEFETFLTDTLGVKVDALKEALTSDEEVRIDFKSENFMDDEKLQTLKTTVKKQGYEEGRVAGVEMEAKRVKEKFGIEAEGKNFDTILDVFSKQTLSKAKIEPNKKVEELNESLNRLQKQYETDLGLKDKEVDELSGKIANFKKNGELRKHIPQGLNGIKQDQFLTLARTSYDFDFDEEGNFIAKNGDQVIKDKFEKPIPVSNLLSDFAIENEWLKQDGGRGGSDDRGGNSPFKTMQDVFAHMKENNINPYGEEGQRLQDEFKNS